MEKDCKMNTTQHTPGPWKAYQGRYSRQLSGPKDESIGEIYNWDGEGTSSAIALEAVANAHLIAAAPELLRACELALLHLDEYLDYRPDDCEDPCMVLKDVIKQAKGQTK